MIEQTLCKGCAFLWVFDEEMTKAICAVVQCPYCEDYEAAPKGFGLKLVFKDEEEADKIIGRRVDAGRE
jgi:hypothetical protein